MAGVYAQDVWSLTPNFRLTYGLRLDMPIYMNSLDSNKSIEELAFVNNTHVDISKWPKTQVLFSPRVGFNWDVKGDRSVIVSGGTGIFTGLLPFVWFTNQPSNSGLYQNMVEYNTQKIRALYLLTLVLILIIEKLCRNIPVYFLLHLQSRHLMS